MLTSLSIKNYALIDDLQVDFLNGFTIITGETGAGKSILLGGLSLILGKRADLSMVKETSKKCIVEGVFDIAKYNLKSFFKNTDLDFEVQTIIRREILPSGKSRAFVNDSPVTLDVLQGLSECLIDIHSQHQTLALTQEQYQLQVIDALANNVKLLESYRSELSTYKLLQSELSSLKELQSEAIKEKDYNAFLLNELEAVPLEGVKISDLEEEFEQLSNVESITESLQESSSIINEDQIGLLTLLRSLASSLDAIKGVSDKYDVLHGRVQSLLFEIEDIGVDIERLQDDVELNPTRLEEVSEKLNVLNTLLQKHNLNSIEELIHLREELSEKVSEIESVDSKIAETEEWINALEIKLNTTAIKLRNKRQDVIPSLINQLKETLGDLGIPNATFKIELEQLNEFTSNGCDSLRFMFSANKGGQLNELKKAASGGELSRIMLSIKHILSKYVKLPTIMFDEIDTGVSGEISNKMGAIMKSMSENMQVFAITHLPQIAAKGDTHFKVFKEDINDVTQTKLIQLTHEDRIVEIAQMLGGTDVSDSAILHAKELLN